MSTQTYELENCLGQTFNRITEIKGECATPICKNLFGETMYQVKEGVKIRAHKKTRNNNGSEVHTTLLLKEGALFVPRAGNIVASSALVEAQEMCNKRWYHFWSPTVTTSLYFRGPPLVYLQGGEVHDTKFDGLERGIYATTRDSDYFHFCN